MGPYPLLKKGNIDAAKLQRETYLRSGDNANAVQSETLEKGGAFFLEVIFEELESVELING